MTPEHGDSALSPLRRLRVVEPDRARAERIRARCHAALASRRLAGERPKARGRLASFARPALAWGLLVGYVSAVVDVLSRLYSDR